MILFPIPRRLAISLAAAALALTAGCSRLLPARHGTAHSYEMVIDTRREPSPALTGCWIPEVVPAVTKIPIIFVQKIPYGAVFTDATVETLLKNGDPLAVLEPVIENNHVYLKCAVPKIDSFTQVQVLVRVKYEYR